MLTAAGKTQPSTFPSCRPSNGCYFRDRGAFAHLSDGVEAAGVKGYTVYNHGLTVFPFVVED
jgi:hypothetical protein